MRFPRRTSLTAVLTLTAMLSAANLCAADAAGEERFILAGSDRAAWLIRTGGNDGTFDVAVKEIGKDWRRLGKAKTGSPLAAAAVADRLHVFFPSGDTIVFNLTDRHGTPGAELKDPVAICESAGAFAEAKTASVVAIVRSGARPAATSTRPAATTLPAATRATTRARDHGRDGHATEASLTNFTAMQYVGGQWREIARLPAVPFGPRGRIVSAVVADVLYVFVAPGSGAPALLLAWRNGVWDKLDPPGPVAGEVPLSAVAIAGRLNLVLPARVLPATSPSVGSQGADAGRRLVLIATLRDRSWQVPPQPITLNGKLKTWPQDRLPMVARLGKNFVLLWRDEAPDGKLKFAVCKPQGQLLAPNPVAIFATATFDEKGILILEYFMWGVLLALLVPMVLLRNRAAGRPFTLDESFTPARLVPRLLALLIDFMPFSFLAAIIFIPDVVFQDVRSWSEFAEKLKAIETEQARTSRFAFYWIATMLMHVSYCILMEARFGATLGKMVFRLRVVGNEGKPASLREVVLRNFVKFIELHPILGMLLPVILLLVILTRHHRRVGDLIAGTVVVNARRRRIPPTPGEPPAPDADTHSDSEPQ